jgi:hypothetical protein
MGAFGQADLRPRVPSRAFPQPRVPPMRQYLVNTAAQHHITAGKQRHQPTGHAINCAPAPPKVSGRLEDLPRRR